MFTTTTPTGCTQRKRGLSFSLAKSGYTVKPAIQRINEHAAAMPEKPTIPFVIKSEWARELESLLHVALWGRKGRAWHDWKFGDGGLEWYLTNPEEIRAEAIKYGQFRKGARKILEEFNAMRTNWTTECVLAAKKEFPNIENPRPLDLLKIPKGK
jgi:hypothetical protein